ncbi:hypothetical protein Tco_1433257 [Tanacetum coccineum]
MVYVVNGVLASGVDMVLEKDLAGFVLREMEIRPLMLLIRTLSMILQTFSPTLHSPSTSHTRVNYVGTTLIMVMIVHHGYRLSMSRNRATIKTLCQPMNQNYFEPNSNYSGFDRPSQYPIDQSPPQEMSIQDMEDLKQQYLEEMQSISNQIQIKDYRNKRIDIRYRRECEFKIDKLKGKFNGMSIEINKKKELQQLEQTANLSTYTTEPSRRFNSFYDDDDYEESTIPLNEIISQIPPSIAITPVFPTLEPEDSLIMGDENLSTIPEKESDEVIKSSVEDLVPIPSDDDESLSDEDVPKDNVKIYSNPLFEFDDKYISSDVNPLFDEVLEDIKSKDSYVSKLDEPDLLVTPFSKLNEDECFDPGGDFVLEEIEACLTSDSILPKIDDDDFDLEGDILLLEKLLNDDLSSPLPTKELNCENTTHTLPPDVFLDHDPRSLEDEPDKDDLKNIVKNFDPGIWEKFFSPTYVKLPFEDRHYLSLTYVIRIFLSYFTYPMDSSLPLSFGSEGDPGISAFHFSSLEPVASHRSGTFMWFNVYLNILIEKSDGDLLFHMFRP